MRRLTASPQEADRVRSAAAGFIGRALASEESLARLAGLGDSVLPRRIVSALRALSGETGPPAVLIRGLTVETDLPPTPRRSDAPPDPRLRLASEAVLLAVAKILGEPLGYRAEKHGAIVQNVFPVEAQRDAPSNESSSSNLDLHTELVFSRRHPQRPLDAESPDFILLGCLRSDPDGAAVTVITAVDDLCAGLGDDELRILSEPRFELRAPYSFTRDRPDDRPWVGPVPILRAAAPPRRAAFDLACGCRGIDEQAAAAFDALRRAATVPGVGERIRLQAGDLLVMDNRRCAHGRTPFAARFDGRDRWILRVYVRRSLAGMVPVDRGFPRVF